MKITIEGSEEEIFSILKMLAQQPQTRQQPHPQQIETESPSQWDFIQPYEGVWGVEDVYIALVTWATLRKELPEDGCYIKGDKVAILHQGMGELFDTLGLTLFVTNPKLNHSKVDWKKVNSIVEQHSLPFLKVDHPASQMQTFLSQMGFVRFSVDSHRTSFKINATKKELWRRIAEQI